MTFSVRWQSSALRHQNHTTSDPLRILPLPNGPLGSDAPAVPLRVPTL